MNKFINDIISDKRVNKVKLIIHIVIPEKGILFYYKYVLNNLTTNYQKKVSPGTDEDIKDENTRRAELNSLITSIEGTHENVSIKTSELNPIGPMALLVYRKICDINNNIINGPFYDGGMIVYFREEYTITANIKIERGLTDIILCTDIKVINVSTKDVVHSIADKLSTSGNNTELVAKMFKNIEKSQSMIQGINDNGIVVIGDELEKVMKQLKTSLNNIINNGNDSQHKGLKDKLVGAFNTTKNFLSGKTKGNSDQKVMLFHNKDGITQMDISLLDFQPQFILKQVEYDIDFYGSTIMCKYGEYLNGSREYITKNAIFEYTKAVRK